MHPRLVLERVFFRTAGLWLDCRWNDLHRQTEYSLGPILGELDCAVELALLCQEAYRHLPSDA